MRIRSLTSLMAASAVCICTAQSPNGGDADVAAALGNLRSQTSLFLRLTGTVTTGKTSHSIDSDEYWSIASDTSGNPVVQTELLEYLDSKLQARIVGDGTTVWSYNLSAREYRAGLYGSYATGSISNTYVKDALGLLNTFTNGFGVFNSKLTNQIYGGNVATYQTWIPGATLTELPSAVSPTVTDVYYSVGNPARRQVIFHLNTSTTQYQLMSIDYFDVTMVGTQQRTTQWTLTPYNVIPSSANYQPYTVTQIPGWRVVATRN